MPSPQISLRRYEFPPGLAALPSWARYQFILPQERRDPALLGQLSTHIARQAVEGLPGRSRGLLSPGLARTLEIVGYVAQAATNPALLPVSIAATEIAKEVAKRKVYRAIRKLRHRIQRGLYEAFRTSPALVPRSRPW